MSTYPLTVAMTPSFLMDGDNLLRAQLRCLSEQTNKDFDVLLVDCHFSKRSGYMRELAETYKLNIKHVPYWCNLAIAKRLDCSIFNAPYCYSESPRIVRYSCWRFVKPDFTEACMSSQHSVDFYFHNVEPPSRDCMHQATNHDARVWPMSSDEVKWDLMPKKSGEPGASWTAHSDVDAALQPFPLACYGNYCVPREDWLNINGCDEAIFSSEHWEDQDFCLRANLAGMKAERKALKMFRMHHGYGHHSGRANVVPDFGEFKKICQKCEAVEYIQKPHRRELNRRFDAGEISIYGQAWVCNECFYCGPVFHADEGEYQSYVRRHKKIRSNIIKEKLIGRNLRALSNDMDGKSLGSKVEIFNESWLSPKYYEQ